MLDQLCHILFQLWTTQEVKSMGLPIRLPDFEPLKVIYSQASVSSPTQTGTI